MKKIFILLVIVSLAAILMAENVEDIITKAKASAGEGNLVESIAILEDGIKQHSNSADLLAEYGLYLSQRAGQVSFLKAGMLSNKAFKQLDEALKIDQDNINARLYRGILAVNVPKFMGKLKMGLADLEDIQTKYGSNPQLYLVSSFYLGMGYSKAEKFQAALAAFKFVMMYGKDSEYYNDAKQRYEALSGKVETTSEVNNYELAMQYYEAGDLVKASEKFKLAAKQSSHNLELHLLYARVLGDLAGQGYDETIQVDVTARAELAHEVFEILSHCVDLVPENDEVRFLRGSVAIHLPFFVESLETGISDLEYLVENGQTDEVIEDAKSLLPKAILQRKINELAIAGYEAKNNPKLQAELLSMFVSSDYSLVQTKPEGKFAKIEIQLGYRDQIAPQCAVWIEDSAGNYLKTIYVSGFAGKVKDKQEHLPRWAKSSEFRNIDAVTGASIDSGKHTLYWDYTKYNNEKFKADSFVVRTEICHWPHVQYHKQSVLVKPSEGNVFKVDGDNFLIPNLEISLSK